MLPVIALLCPFKKESAISGMHWVLYGIWYTAVSCDVFYLSQTYVMLRLLMFKVLSFQVMSPVLVLQVYP